jgi:hypothetical protein
MPYKDPEKEKEYRRELMRARRATLKVKKEALTNEENKNPQAAPDTRNPTEEIKKPEVEKPEEIKVEHQSYIPDALGVKVDYGDELPPPLYPSVNEENYREVARQTKRDLEKRGWALWKCSKLNNDIIVIVKNHSVSGYPDLLPVYTLEEIEKSTGWDAKSLNMVHHAKKIAQAQLL